MATVRLNDKGNRIALELVKSGAVEKAETWRFSAEESAAILGDPPDWDRFGDHHLGIRTGVSRKTKQGFAYPFGKGGKVFRSALISARQRAAQQGHSAVFNAAGSILQELDGEVTPLSAHAAIAENMSMIGAFAAAPVPIAWSSLPELVVQLLPFTGDEYAKTVDGRKVKVTDESTQSIADRFNARENPLLLDYEHGTFNPLLEMGTLAAGWINEIWPVASDANIEELADERVREAADLYGPGVYAVVNVTPKAAELIENREYQFLSPVIVQNDDNVVLEILGAGLTNDPNLDGMMPIAARRSASVSMETARGDDDSDAAGEDPTGPDRKKQGDMDMDIEVLAALVGRKLESESDVKEAIAELKAKAETADAHATKIAELEADKLTREASEAVATAITEGRLSESQKDWALELFKSDRKAWDSYLSATSKGTFSAEKKIPPQDRLTDTDGGDSDGVPFPENVNFFGSDIPVDKEKLAKLNSAIALSRDKFGGDLFKAIRAVRR